jgi:hypothetical protein
MSAVRITLWPPRTYIFNRRIHHVWPGVLLILSDLKDWRVWLRDLLFRDPDTLR